MLTPRISAARIDGTGEEYPNLKDEPDHDVLSAILLATDPMAPPKKDATHIEMIEKIENLNKENALLYRQI